jgi:hypothetical protein
MIKKFIKIAILVLIVGSISVIPILRIRTVVGSAWRGVMPSYVTDSLFYFMQIVKGTAHIPFGNTPFFIEHANDINATPSIAMFLAAIPLKFGLSFATMLILDLVVWNSIFVYLLAVLLEQLGVRRPWTWWLVAPVYLEVYWMAVRPAVMETVFPFFILFLVALVSWLKNSKRSSVILLAFSFAATFYIYPYTWQVSGVTLALVFLLFLTRRDWSRLKDLLIIGLGAFVLALPAFIYIYREISHPLFAEFISHAGSIQTHLPSPQSFYIARWIIFNLAIWFGIERLVPKLKNDADFIRAGRVIALIGLAIFALLLSPIITGHDAVIGEHLTREMYLWLALSASILFYFVWNRSGFIEQRASKKFIIAGLMILNFIPVITQYKRSVLLELTIDQAEAVYIQRYAAPIAWLDQHENQPTAVWANPDISDYILIYSRHYALMLGQGLAGQYFVPQSEIRERYLTSQYFKNIDSKLIMNEYDIVLGNTDIIQTSDLNFKLKLCRLFKLQRLSVCDSGALTSLQEARDRKIQDLIVENNKIIRPRIYDFLKKYHVAYAIKDLSRDQNFHVETLKGAREVYDVGGIAIYSLGAR